MALYDLKPCEFGFCNELQSVVQWINLFMPQEYIFQLNADK